jgi:RNA polymerase sigma factor (TIGR02999 family)
MDAVDGGQSQITSLLSAVGTGDAAAAERLWRLVYDELHRIAQSKMAQEGRRGDIQTTVLVQEAYLRLVGNDGAAIPAHRPHFFAAAANAMRQFLVDDARKRGRLKRGAKQTPGELGGALGVFENDPAELLALDEALRKLRERDPQKAEIVQLRFFAGLTIDETAEALGVSSRLVDKEWRFAKAWLKREMA